MLIRRRYARRLITPPIFAIRYAATPPPPLLMLRHTFSRRRTSATLDARFRQMPPAPLDTLPLFAKIDAFAACRGYAICRFAD